MGWRALGSDQSSTQGSGVSTGPTLSLCFFAGFRNVGVRLLYEARSGGPWTLIK